MGERAPRHAGWWAALVAVGAASCGGEAFTTGDAGPAPDATAANVGAPDASSSDAGVEPPHDAAHAEAAPVEAGATDWCATHTGHTFCEDFDHYPNVDAVFGNWSSFEQMNGNFKLDMVGAPSPPNALEAIGASGAKVVVLKTLPAPDSPKKIHLEFDLRVDSPGNVTILSAAGIAAIAFGDSVSDGYAALAIDNGPTLAGFWVKADDAGAGDAGTFQAANATGMFPTSGMWAGRYAIEVDYTSGNACVQVYEGTMALLASCLVLPENLRHPTTVSAVLGDYAGGLQSTGSVDVEFDNVTFDVL